MAKNCLSRDKFSATGTTENENENLHRSGLPASSPNSYRKRIAPLESGHPQPQTAVNVDTEEMDRGSQCWPGGANRFQYLGFAPEQRRKAAATRLRHPQLAQAAEVGVSRLEVMCPSVR